MNESLFRPTKSSASNKLFTLISSQCAHVTELMHLLDYENQGKREGNGHNNHEKHYNVKSIISKLFI